MITYITIKHFTFPSLSCTRVYLWGCCWCFKSCHWVVLIMSVLTDWCLNHWLHGWWHGGRIAARRFCLVNKGTSEKMGISGNDDKKSEHETSAPKQKRSYAKKEQVGWKKDKKSWVGIHKGKQVRKCRGRRTRTLDVPKEQNKRDYCSMLKTFSWEK